MQKLNALLPLLGWFYISLIIYAALRVFTKGELRKIIDTAFFVVIGVVSLYNIGMNVRDEIAIVPFSMKSFYVPFEQKIDHEAGDYYGLYYVAFHSHVKRGEIVNLVGVGSREFHYARMYLFPASVVQVDKLPEAPYVAMVGDNELERLKTAKVRAAFRGRNLIEMEAMQ